MKALSRHRRRLLAPFVIATWLFALFVSFAHACGLDEAWRAHGHPADVAHAVTGQNDDGRDICDKFCADDLPVSPKVEAAQDTPSPHVLMVPSFAGAFARPAAAPAAAELAASRPPPASPVATRFVRLAL